MPETIPDLTLYQFIMPVPMISPSSYCVKAEVLLKLAGLPYTNAAFPGELSDAPKGKLPVLKDGDQLIPDSEFIRQHLAKKYSIDWDADLTPEQAATALILCRMLDNHTMSSIVYSRWVDERYAPISRQMFFAEAPEEVANEVFSYMKSSLEGHGMGRHTPEEVLMLALDDMKAASNLLSNKDFYAGDKPTWVDASLFGTLANVFAPAWNIELAEHTASTYPNIKAYIDRCTDLWFPEVSKQAAAE